MHDLTRRSFVRNAALGLPAIAIAPELLAKKKKPLNRFQIGIQEYTFHRWLGSRKLKHLDYPALAKKELGITHIEYWNRPFGGKHTDKKYVGELAKRTTGEGMKNVLILIDAGNELDAKDPKQRARSVEEHKGWVDCAAQLGCDAIRVNCRSGGSREENMKNAVEGMRAICDYAKGSKVKIVIEPHGGYSNDPDWLLAVIKKLNHPNAGLLPDFNNFGRYDRYDGVKRTLAHAPAICAKALNFDDKGNETRTDYYRMMKIIHQSSYSGVITIEFEGHKVDPIAGSLKTKALIQKALKAAAA